MKMTWLTLYMKSTYVNCWMVHILVSWSCGNLQVYRIVLTYLLWTVLKLWMLLTYVQSYNYGHLYSLHLWTYISSSVLCWHCCGLGLIIIVQDLHVYRLFLQRNPSHVSCCQHGPDQTLVTNGWQSPMVNSDQEHGQYRPLPRSVVELNNRYRSI